jgi:hypothetical protein
VVVLVPSVTVRSYVPVFIGAVQTSSQRPAALAVVCPFPTFSTVRVICAPGAAVPLMVKGTPSA